MEKFDELLKKLNKLRLLQTSCWDDNIPANIWDEYFKKNYKGVASEVDVDKHRWYEIATAVIEIFGRFLGIRHISNMYSEEMDFEGCYCYLEFFEMEEIEIKSYKKIK